MNKKEILFDLLENNKIKKNSHIKTNRSIIEYSDAYVISHSIFFDLTAFSIRKYIDNKSESSYDYYTTLFNKTYSIDDVIKEVEIETISYQRNKKLNELL